MKPKIARLIFFIGVMSAAALVALLVDRYDAQRDSSLQSETYRVADVVDGDTIDVEIDGAVERVRYIGIDTPESVKPGVLPQCFSKEASARNAELVEGKYVRLEKDVSERDDYGRLLRYVFVGDTFVNLELVRQGFAHAVTFPPDVARSAEFRAAEQDARLSGRGLWGSCTAPEPQAAEDAPVPGCTIKGNISLSGEKIYHLSSCQSYGKTAVNEAAGERWFCSEEEALAAGWRKAATCS